MIIDTSVKYMIDIDKKIAWTVTDTVQRKYSAIIRRQATMARGQLISSNIYSINKYKQMQYMYSHSPKITVAIKFRYEVNYTDFDDCSMYKSAGRY